jgi:ABC-type multidrug transport system ATPase subunit
VRQQLEFCARIAMIPRDELPDRVARALSGFELLELQARRVDRMSMGQRQRLRLAISLLNEPSLLLLDEPLTSLDAEAAQLLHVAVDAIRARGGAVLWCSPSGEEPDRALDATYTLTDARLVAA